MRPEARKRIQLALLAGIALAALRTGYILYERHQEKAEQTKKQEAPPLDSSYLVSPRKLYPYDLKSAKQLTQQPVWVRDGYRYTYYPFDRSGRHPDFSKEAGQLLPIEKLQILDVVTAPTPGAADQKQLVATFEKDGKRYAVPVGVVKEGNYQIYSDEMFFIQDPRDLYKDWTRATWDAIAQHDVKPGMNEFQVAFAVGMGIPQPSSDPATKTVNYPNGSKPVNVTFRNGRAAEITSPSK
jgi:hypothetical protein